MATLFTVEKKDTKLLFTKHSTVMSWGDLEQFITECSDDALDYQIEIHQASDTQLEVYCENKDLDSFIKTMINQAYEEQMEVLLNKDTEIYLFENEHDPTIETIELEET